MRYELSYILKSDLEETKIKEVTQNLVGFISKIGEKPKITIQLKILELAYPIKKQTQGLWGALEFDIEAKRLSELEKKLKDTKEIIRFMLTKKVKKVIEKKKKPAQSQASGRARQTAELSAGKKLKEAPKKEPKEEEEKEKKEKQKLQPQKDKKEERAEIKDLDKKLDEILKQI